MNKVKMEDNTVDQVCSEVHTFRLFTFLLLHFFKPRTHPYNYLKYLNQPVSHSSLLMKDKA